MNREENREAIEVCITYSPLNGCTLKAVCLAREIECCFDIPVRIVEGRDGIFNVVVNGRSIYRKAGACDPGESDEAIFTDIRKLKRPIRNRPTHLPDGDEQNDPDYLEWLRSVCSGE